MFPTAYQYTQVIVPKIQARSNGCCEVCGRDTFTWVTPKRDMENWGSLANTGVTPLPLDQSNLIAVCYRCAGPYLKPANEYYESKVKPIQTDLPFNDWDKIALELGS